MTHQLFDSLTNNFRKGVLTTALLVSVGTLLAGCGDSGGSSTADNGGIGGSGITATGPIDSFGSIFVNGIEFETGSAIVVLDSDPALESALKLGMVVTVRGSVDSDGDRGTADSVEFDDAVEGPIDSIATDADGTTKTLEILGLTVLAIDSSTVFDDVTFATLGTNDLVEVSGFLNGAGDIVATRIEKKGIFVAGVSEIELKGTVSNLDTVGLTFDIGVYEVDYAAAILDGFPPGGLADGQFVEVEGTLNGTDITANEVELEDDLYSDDDDDISLEGIITDYMGDDDFRIFGQPIDASGAVKVPAGLVLQNGVEVEVEGSLVAGVLVATSVEAREGDVELAATVQSIDVTGNSGTITLAFAGGTVTFAVDNQTELDDDTDTYDPFELSDLRTGDFVEVKGLLDGSTIVATELELENADDERVQGPVESFNTITQTITIFGLTFTTTGADFEDINDAPLSAGVFFTQLNAQGVGTLVKIKDDLVANGVADEVEFED